MNACLSTRSLHRWNRSGVYRKSTESGASRTYPRRIRRLSCHRLSSKQEYTGPGGSETTWYIGGILERVYDGSTTDWRHFITAEGQTVAIVSRKSTSVNAVHYPLEDNQGSGSHLTNSSGATVVRQSYTAFGLPRDGDDWDGAESSGDLTTMEGISRRGYTGHSMLGRMGLIHMNGRVQDAVTGRFLSPDPHIPDPGFTQSFNRYAYVNNNPLTYIDPSGFEDLNLDEVLVEAYRLSRAQREALERAGIENAALCQALYGNTICDAGQAQSAFYDQWYYLTQLGSERPQDVGNTDLFGLKTKIQNAIDESVAKARYSTIAKLLGAAGTALNQFIVPENKTEAAMAVLGPVGKLGKLERVADAIAPSLDDLSRAAGAARRGGFTDAGRSLQKHTSRPESKWSQSDINANNPAAANARGQELVDDVLTTPGSRVVPNGRGGWDVVAPDGRTIRYNRDGSFQGLRE